MTNDDTRRIFRLGLVAVAASLLFPPSALAAWAAGGVVGYRGFPWRGALLVLTSILTAGLGVAIIGGLGI